MAIAPIPVLKRQETNVKQTNVPEFQSSFEKLGESENIAGAIGSQVAQSASNQMAAQLGTASGQHPTGDIKLPSLTEFDKNFAESYKTQAGATLGLQANKLISDANLYAAQSPRMTPELIKQTQANISLGLKKIYDLAPTDVRSKLENVYNASQLTQLEHLTNRMIQEQNEDKKNKTILSNNQNAETAHALSSTGKYDAAIELAKENEKLNKSTVASNVGFTPQQGKVGNDTVRLSAISGRLQYEYDKAVIEKKGDEYLKSLAKRPDWISDADYPSAMQNIKSYVNNQESLKSNYEQLVMSQFNDEIISRVAEITGTELQSALDKLSPVNASKLSNQYERAYKAYKKDETDQSYLSQHWDDSRAQANSTPKIQNQTFNGKVAYAMANDPNLTREKAENQVAASAGGPIPVFIDTLQKSLWGGDPKAMVSAATQIDDLQSHGHGHALKGLNDADLAIASDIKHTYNPADPASAARIITQNKQNQDFNFKRDSEAIFANNLYSNTVKIGVNQDKYILNKFKMNKFDSPWSKSHYATDILTNYRTNFINTGRDENRSSDLTKNYIKNSYGKTLFNGDSEWTKHPIEKACGFAEGEGIGTINQDIMRQLAEPLDKLKARYDAKETNEYWTMEPEMETRSAFSIRSDEYIEPGDIKKLNFIKHTREGFGQKTETYPLRLVGNDFNWDINLETTDGPLSIFLMAPIIGVNTYTPDVEWIKWMKEH